MDKKYLLNMTAEEFNSKILCEGLSSVIKAAEILNIKINKNNRWEATEQLYKSWKNLKNNK